ncbi:MAG: hypothetical protein A2X64_09010 [Ignavibacteria bacterium GWF2_33_9]|nr:MAG: hypothetical protein A2X64_09010 [Ignavibacteria bacterium GWF2_33_9]
MKRISKEYYLNSTEKLARDLLGSVFVKKINQNEYIAAEIVETEAYLPQGDLACHAAVKKTPRNAPMFESGGILYIYFIYGNHFCSNIVTETEGKGSAVLIRAAKPLEGISEMQQNRGVLDIRKLCNGPGNFSKAFGLNKGYNYLDLSDYENSEIQLFRLNNYPDNEIIQTTRIGIKKHSELPLRFYVRDSEFISRK